MDRSYAVNKTSNEFAQNFLEYCNNLAFKIDKMTCLHEIISVGTEYLENSIHCRGILCRHGRCMEAAVHCYVVNVIAEESIIQIVRNDGAFDYFEARRL